MSQSLAPCIQGFEGVMFIENQSHFQLRASTDKAPILRTFLPVRFSYLLLKPLQEQATCALGHDESCLKITYREGKIQYFVVCLTGWA